MEFDGKLLSIAKNNVSLVSDRPCSCLLPCQPSVSFPGFHAVSSLVFSFTLVLVLCTGMKFGNEFFCVSCYPRSDLESPLWPRFRPGAPRSFIPLFRQPALFSFSQLASLLISVTFTPLSWFCWSPSDLMCSHKFSRTKTWCTWIRLGRAKKSTKKNKRPSSSARAHSTKLILSCRSVVWEVVRPSGDIPLAIRMIWYQTALQRTWQNMSPTICSMIQLWPC
mmetsp:Transcript_6175/g.12371  ORF Transcript_6175/g.12371 Transcript_6175/m.12371 type:complete len:222 (-) Transcript_6175:207-872(-)